MKADAVLETCLYVDDLDAATRFYSDVLGLELVAAEEGRHAFFRCGRAMVLLFNPHATVQHDTAIDGSTVPGHGATGPGHVAFRAEPDDLDRWREHLMGKGVTIETEINWPHGAVSIYFRDPAGNSLELATPNLWGFD